MQLCRGSSLFPADVGMFAPMVGSLSKTDSEIGARMGICFAFNSEFFLFFVLSSHSYALDSYVGFGGLIGTLPTNFSLNAN